MARLFHSLVVCGAGLTLFECGGRVATHVAVDDSTSGAGGSSAAPGGAANSTSGSSTVSATGGVSAQAGTPSAIGGLNLGGVETGGVGGTFASAGTAFGGATVDILPGAEGQWVCDSTNVQGCIDVPVGRPMLGFSITTPCRAETTRPKGPADCDPGTLFTCVTGNYAEKLVLFNCVCMPQEPNSCACPSLRSGCSGVDYQASLCEVDQAYCGCAYTCILK